MKNTESESLASIDKALGVLHHLHAQGRACGPSEIGRALELPRSTVHRLLTALGRRGFVEVDAQGQYRPGMALIALGLGVLEREPLVMAARPVLERAADAVGETLFLAAARGGRVLVLDKAEGPAFLRASPRIGSEIPAHATAIGKVYLAHRPEQLRADAVLQAFTAHTCTDPSSLALEVARVRELGYAESHEEWLEGLTGFAAAVSSGGKMVGAVSVTGAAQRMRERERFIEAVQQAATDVMSRLRGS